MGGGENGGRSIIAFFMPPSPLAADNLPAAFAMTMGGVVLICLMDPVAKILTETLPLYMVVCARFVFHTLWMTPAVLWRAQKTPLRLGDFRGHALRGLLIALATLCFFAAIRDNPIPDTIAIFFVEPIFVMLLAAMFLGEKLRRRRIVAALTAFVGVLIVMRPGGGHYEPSIFFALLAGFFFAGYLVATRMSSSRGSPLTAAWGAALTAAAFSAPFAAWDWQTPTEREWWLIVLLGALAASGHWALTCACRWAAAALIGIFHYAEILAAAVVSYFLFAHIPDFWVWPGFALIAGANTVVTLLEMREKKKAARPPK